MADAILNLSEAEKVYLWEAFSKCDDEPSANREAIFRDYSPKIDKINSGEWPELSPAATKFMQDMQSGGGFPMGFVEMVVSGRTKDLLPSAAPSEQGAAKK